jgi:hypothetical protein
MTELRNIIKQLSQDNRFRGRDLNLESAEDYSTDFPYEKER